MHISDLHFRKESIGHKSFRELIKDKLDKDELTSADCIVISGDSFNRGSLSVEEAEICRDFLNGLPGHNNILAVPGNHDLDRMARTSKNGGWNLFTSRRELVVAKSDELAKNDNRGEFEISSDDEKAALYAGAFQGFEGFAEKMGFLSFKGNGDSDAERYEVQCVDLPFGRPDYHGYQIRFVLLNTALIAGQSFHGDNYKKKLRVWEQAYQKALNAGDSLKAAKLRMDIASQQERYLTDGELIIDDGEPRIDENGNMTTELKAGKMSLSRAGLARLSKIKRDSDSIALTVFVGHHGFQFLSPLTQDILKNAMKQCGSGIYLCGHAHEVRFKRFTIQGNTAPREILQFQAGRMFKDDENLTQHGFNYGVFEVTDDGRLSGTVKSYFYSKSPSEEFQWHMESIDCDFPNFRIAPFSDSTKTDNNTNTNLENSSGEKNVLVEPYPNQPLNPEDSKTRDWWRS